MNESIPDYINIEFVLNPQIKATYFKSKKIVFREPEDLKGRTVKNIFEASYVVRNRPSFPYSDWTVTEPKNSWSVYSFEFAATKYVKQLKTIDPDAKVDMAVDTDAQSATSQSAIVNPYNLPPHAWTSEIVSRWITTHQNPELTLRQISHFRRYNHGLSFEFLCIWDILQSSSSRDVTTTTSAMTWQKYTDLCQNDTYAEYIRKHWDAKVEKERNWEDELDRHPQVDEGFDVFLPESGSAYAVEKITLRAQKLIERERMRDKKRKQSKQKKSRPQKISRNSDEDAASDEVSEISSSSESSIALSSESGDEKQPADDKQVQAQATADVTQENVEWMDVFELSSVSPVPRYKVKKFKSSE